MLLTGMFICYLYVFYCIVEEQPGASGLQQAQHGMYVSMFISLYITHYISIILLFVKLCSKNFNFLSFEVLKFYNCSKSQNFIALFIKYSINISIKGYRAS